MKTKSKGFFAIALSLGLAALCLAPATPAQAALVGYWNFDEGTGTTANDFSPNANHGTLKPGPLPAWVDGHTGDGPGGDYALNFQFGNAPRVEVLWSPSLGTITSNFTMAAWSRETGGSNYGHIFSTTTDFGTRDWLFQTSGYGGDSQYVWSDNFGSWKKRLNEWVLPINSQWYHRALTYDGTTLRCYQDGGFVTSVGVGVNFPASSGALLLGGWLAGGSSFIGDLDDMIIFNSVEDVVSIMNGTHPDMQAPPPAGIEVVGEEGNGEVTGQANPQPEILEVEKTVNGLSPFDMEIEVTGGMELIDIIEQVLNESQTEWEDYHFELGTGLGPDFVPSGEGDGLYFTGGSSSAFAAMLGAGGDSLSFFDGTVWPGGTAGFQLQIHTPGDDPYTFTLRQTPSVPEPVTMAMLSLAAAGLGGYVRRRRRA